MAKTTKTFSIGNIVSFMPGPRSASIAQGKVVALGTGSGGQFMDVESVDAKGEKVTRKVRPGAATLVSA